MRDNGHRFMPLLIVLVLPATADERYNAGSMAARWSLDGYRLIVSPLLGHRTCNFHPTCSRFSSQALERYGLVTGLLMTSDRLQRCNPYASLLSGSYYLGTTGSRMNDPVGNHAPGPAPTAYLPGSAPAPARVGNRWTPDSAACPAWSNRLAFADHLFKLGDFQRAAGEYRRAAFADTLELPRRYARLMIAESHHSQGDFFAAARAFHDALSTWDYELCRLGLARSLLQLGRYAAARHYAELVGNRALAVPSAKVGALADFRQYDFAAGATRLDRCAPDSVTGAASSMARTRLPARSRLVGTALSTLVPGLGQVYARHPGDGLYSFLIVGTCAAVSSYYWLNSDQDPNRVKLGIFAGLTLLFHAGNIYGASLAVRDFNRLQQRNLLHRLEAVLTQESLVPDYRDLLRE